MKNPHSVILYPFVTEKTMSQMERENKLEFIVDQRANKIQIKKAFEELFEGKVRAVNTKIRKDGKHAIIQLKPEFSAEEIGMRIGIF